MTKTLYVYFVAICLSAACSSSAQKASPADPQHMPKGSNVNPDAGLLATFNAKVKEYNDLRSDLQKKAPPLKKTDDPAEIERAERALAQQVRAARANAKPGDIFTPATQAMFRRLLRPPLKGGDGAENKAAMKEDTPAATDVRFKVNGEYPKEEPLGTVPTDVLKALPPLPEPLQYRFAGKHMLLYCTRGNLIVDYMLNALP
jgi:hypothetical protein